jgi:hypothetical protein
MNKRIDLGKEAILALLIKMSWPSIIAMVAMSLYNFIDTFWLAKLGAQALSALTICFPIQLIFAAIGIGNSIGAGSIHQECLAPVNCLRLGKRQARFFSVLFLRSAHDYCGPCFS